MRVKNNITIAVIESENTVIKNVETAFDLMATICFTTDATVIVIDKNLIFKDFFNLRNKILGEVIQKFATYKISLAVVGDFSNYKSESLKDFIYESNKGNILFFAKNEEEAFTKFSS